MISNAYARDAVKAAEFSKENVLLIFRRKSGKMSMPLLEKGISYLWTRVEL